MSVSCKGRDIGSPGVRRLSGDEEKREGGWRDGQGLPTGRQRNSNRLLLVAFRVCSICVTFYYRETTPNWIRDYVCLLVTWDLITLYTVLSQYIIIEIFKKCFLFFFSIYSLYLSNKSNWIRENHFESVNILVMLQIQNKTGCCGLHVPTFQ